MFVDCEWRPNEQKYYLESDPRVECWDMVTPNPYTLTLTLTW